MTGKSATTNCSHASMFMEMILDPEHRFSGPLWHQGTLYITDGRILIEMQNQTQPEGAWLDDGERFHPPKAEGEKTWQRPISLKTVAECMNGVGQCCELMPAVDGPPEELDRLWQSMDECDRCDGRGWRECDMGHEHDCDECSGEGMTLNTNPAAHERLFIAGVTVARRYAWIVSQLPGVTVGKADGVDALAFRFDGGSGILMAVRS